MRRQVKKREEEKNYAHLKLKEKKTLQKLLYSFSSTRCALPYTFLVSLPFLGGVLVTWDAAAHLKNCPGEKLQLPLLVKEYAPRARARDG